MAIRALEHRVIGRVLMTITAHLGAAMRHREPSVVECGSRPSGCGVARRARGRESCGGMVRIRGAVVIRRVARETGSRRSGEDVSDMTTGAGDICMRPRQRERRLAVIERGRAESCGAVAEGAILGESRGDMVGIGGAVELGQMARHAGRRQGCILPVCVTARALQVGVRTRERELRFAVIECRTLP